MSVITQGKQPAEFIMSEASGMRSRDTITILSGEGVLDPGTVLGLVGDNTGTVTVGTPTAAAGNTGNGTMTKANPAYGAGVKEGTYRIVALEPITNLGTFAVEDPDGVTIGTAKVGVAFDDVIKFTIADGATDFVAGDTFTLAVSIAAAASMGKYRVADPTNTDGSQFGVAISIYGVDATSSDVKVAAITRDAEVNGNCIAYDANVDDAGKKATQVVSLARVGIIVR